MKVEIKVLAAGESVTEATVANILKPSGSFVNKEEEILELETDKVNQVIYAPEKGTVELLVSQNQKVQIGQVIGYIETSGTPLSAPSQPQATKEEKKLPEIPQTQPQTKDEVGLRNPPEAYIASLGEKKAEVFPLPVASSPPIKIPKEEGQVRKRMSGLRRIIAKRLVEVKNQTAMLTTFNEVDMSEVMAIRSKEKESFPKKYGVKLGFMSFFVKGCVQILKELPDVHAFIDGEEIVYNQTCDIGISVSTDKGLMVPVIRGCEKLTFAEIEKAIQLFATKAREGSISLDDLKGGSFTITNGGVFGSMLSTPILNPPQSAILGMHSIVKRAVVVEDQIVMRPIMYLALSYDHRIIDGKEAVTFLVRLKEVLEKPEKLLLDF
ncbi:MAG: dihydrolipoyllysine-residue succinyltransferase [Chlamydiales bacterium]|nr:dihydrolipoyllysine-residue succinyltransferase [Chlamydiales bacterium]